MLFPQQLQRHPRPAQLTVDCRPVRLRPTILGGHRAGPRGLAAILRLSKPTADSLSTSRILRMGNLGSGITRFVQKERSHAHSRITQRRLSPPSKGSSRSPESVAGFRRLVAIAIIRRAQLQPVSAPRFIKGLDRNFSSK
jgi:hypothetical protein